MVWENSTHSNTNKKSGKYPYQDIIFKKRKKQYNTIDKENSTENITKQVKIITLFFNMNSKIHNAAIKKDLRSKI